MTTKRKRIDQPSDAEFCGCCGRQMTGKGKDVNAFDSLWCRDCAGHVAATGPIAERTYFALNDKQPCPYSIMEVQ